MSHGVFTSPNYPQVYETNIACVLYGVFTSPNYPQVYETNIACVLYTFMGDDDEIVQLTFTDFDMEQSITNK